MSQGRRKAAKPATAFSFIGTGLSYIALCLAGLAALVLVVVPLVTGSQTYSVLTSSMAPKYAPGTFLVVKPVPFNELQLGDIITYQIESGKDAVITHRITSAGTTASGERVLYTKGDNNALADELPVSEVQVRGKLFYAVPFVGFAANALGNSDRGAALQWGAVALMGYGVVALVRGALAKKRNDDDSTAAEGHTLEGPEGGATDMLPNFEFSPETARNLDDLGYEDPILTDCDGCDHSETPNHALRRRKHATV